MARAGGVVNVDAVLKMGLRELKDFAKQLGVDLSGCTSKIDMQDRVLQASPNPSLQEQRIPDDRSRDYGGFTKAQKVSNKTTKEFVEKLTNVRKLYSDLPPKLQGNIQSSYPDLPRDIQDREDALKKGEVWVIVAGEVGAGKSSAINLFLDFQLLPTDALKCSNTIVEIRNSERKEAICYFRPEYSDSGRQRRISPEIIKMDSMRGIQSFKDCVVESDDSDDNPYDRIELFYPIKSLEKGVVIVDTPGVEGGNNIDHRLQRYLSKAFGFIYVINTNTAGGVQQSRLGHLLKTVVNTSEDGGVEASLFIGNKWENVPEADKEDVQKDVFQKLSKVYPGIRNRQIHYMSVNQARDVYIRHKQKTQEHTELLEKIGTLVPNSQRQGLTKIYWWTSSFLQRVHYLLRVTGVQHESTHEEMEAKYKQIQQRVLDLQRNSEKTIKELQERVDYKEYQITKMIVDELKSRQFTDFLCNWHESECPSPARKWKYVADAASVAISERIAHALDNWESNQGVLRRIEEDILNAFRTEFGLLQHQLEDIEGFLSHSRGRGQLMQTVRVVEVKKLFARKKNKIEKTYHTIGGAVSCYGMLDTSKSPVKKLFRDYSDRSRVNAMRDASIIFLDSILKQENMHQKLRKFFARFHQDIDEAAKRLPVFLKADQQLIETLSNSINEIETLRNMLPDLLTRCLDMHGGLDIFFVNNIMTFDYDIRELDWEGKTYLGDGTFANVYKSQILHKKRPVALKVAKFITKTDNVTEILTEDRTMRDLNHPNVVRYYGAATRYSKEKCGETWIMVMELCKESLKSYYTGRDRDKHCPGRTPQESPCRPDVFTSFLRHCLDIASGIQYIHQKGYTHRDMKLENCLITDNSAVKITDVGVAKITQWISNTRRGSPAYMAPEVLQSTEIQTNKIDIFSIAFIIWEMWFGEDVTVRMADAILEANTGDPVLAVQKRQSDPKRCWRPSFKQSSAPPDVIKTMIERCWAFEPGKRPTAEETVRFFSEILKNQ